MEIYSITGWSYTKVCVCRLFPRLERGHRGALGCVGDFGRDPVMWFSLRSPELAEDFERLMAGDRGIVRGSLDRVSEWRLTRPLDFARTVN